MALLPGSSRVRSPRRGEQFPVRHTVEAYYGFEIIDELLEEPQAVDGHWPLTLPTYRIIKPDHLELPLDRFIDVSDENENHE